MSQTRAKRAKAGQGIQRNESAQQRRDEASGTEYYGRREDEASKTRGVRDKNRPSNPQCRLPCTSSSSSSTTLSLLTELP